MNYDFQKMPSFDLKKAALTASAFKPVKTGSNSQKVLNKYWEDLKLDKNKQPLLFLPGNYISLIDGNQKPWKEFLLHKTVYVKGKVQKEIVCSSGIDQYNKKPCTGCFYFDNGPKKENPWYPKVTIKLNVISLSLHHNNVPYMKKGELAKREDGSQIYITERCLGKKDCEYCGTLGNPTINSRLMKVVLTGTHFSQLMAYNKKLMNKCSGCGTTIVLNDYSCSKCGEQLLDVANSRFSEEYLEQFANTPVQCTKCGETNLPQEGIDCGYDEEGTIKEFEKCPLDYPVRMNIFNSISPISKDGEKQQSKLDFGDKKSLLPNSLIKYNHISKLPIEELVKAALAVNNNSLFDLDKEIRIETPEDQAAILGVENPYKEEITFPSSNVEQLPSNNFPVKFNKA